MHPEYAFHLNLGNNRPNISQIVLRTQRAEDFLERCVTLLKGLKPGPTGRLPRSLLFFETRDEAQSASLYFRHLADMSDDVQAQINYIHAGRTKQGRERVMARFREGSYNILCATECVGLGADLPDIEVVILVKVPRDLPTLLQRIGRAGRNGRPARAFIIAESACFEKYTHKKPKSPKKKKGKGKVQLETSTQTRNVEELAPHEIEAVPGNIEYRKKMDPALRAYLEEKVCRRQNLEEFFDSPPPRSDAPNSPVPCCDLCLRATLPNYDEETDGDDKSGRLIPHILTELDRKAPLSSHPASALSLASILSAAAVIHIDEKKKTKTRVKIEIPSPAIPRHQEHKEVLETRLLELRHKIFCDPALGYSASGFSPDGLFSSEAIEYICADLSLSSLDKICTHPLVSSSKADLAFLAEHGHDLITLIDTFAQEVWCAAARTLQEQQRAAQEKKDLKKRKRPEDEEKDQRASEALQQKAIEDVSMAKRARMVQSNPAWQHGPLGTAAQSSSSVAFHSTGMTLAPAPSGSVHHQPFYPPMSATDHRHVVHGYAHAPPGPLPISPYGRLPMGTHVQPVAHSHNPVRIFSSESYLSLTST